MKRTKLIDRLLPDYTNGEENFNMIIESPMKNSRTAFWVHDTLTPLGYTVEAHIMATPKEVSWQGTIDRFNEQLEKGEIPRYVPKEFHDMCAENITSALSEVYESGRMASIYIFNRQGEILYDKSITPSINPSSIVDGVVNYGQMGGRTMTNNANKELIEQARQADLTTLSLSRQFWRTSMQEESARTLSTGRTESILSEIRDISLSAIRISSIFR